MPIRVEGQQPALRATWRSGQDPRLRPLTGWVHSLALALVSYMISAKVFNFPISYFPHL